MKNIKKQKEKKKEKKKKKKKVLICTCMQKIVRICTLVKIMVCLEITRFLKYKNGKATYIHEINQLLTDGLGVYNNMSMKKMCTIFHFKRNSRLSILYKNNT